eukprot:COSAG01_NODE_26641_length_707_cov_2.097039_1_plen_136_part_10
MPFTHTAASLSGLRLGALKRLARQDVVGEAAARACCPYRDGRGSVRRCDTTHGTVLCVLCCETNGRAAWPMHGSSSPRCPSCCCGSAAQELGVSAQELEAVDDEEQPQAALAALIEARARARATGASHAQRKRQFV